MTDRIRALLTLRNLTPTQFADLIQVGRPIVSHILSGRNKASLDVVQRIVAAFPEVALPWLLTGAGPMLAATVAPTNPVEAQPVVIPALPALTVSPEAPIEVINPAKPKPSPPDAEVDSAQPIAAFKSPKRLVEQQEGVSQAPSVKASAGLRQPPRKFRAAAAPALGSAPSEQAPLNSGSKIEPVYEPERALQTGVGTSSTVLVGVSSMPFAAQHPSKPQTDAQGQPEPSVAPPTAGMSALLADKPIRRIVIFYQDGSFSDFQPEK